MAKAPTAQEAIYTRHQNLARAKIEKYGVPALLRRSTGDRPCVAFLSDKSHTRTANLINQADRQALVSPVGLTVDPDSELDKLVTLDPRTGLENETLRIIAPINKLAPADIVIYWILQIRK